MCTNKVRNGHVASPACCDLSPTSHRLWTPWDVTELMSLKVDVKIHLGRVLFEKKGFLSVSHNSNSTVAIVMQKAHICVSRREADVHKHGRVPAAGGPVSPFTLSLFPPICLPVSLISNL